ncbi:myb-like protein AA [Culex quinquefasciatus]|uniref:myb-like protein AA n=1 Tax=Culex quinquefasciatus TaxID=7176 RepID=UPI0018E34CA2|nr:myb-like protein AA [Culex quinquefasciatus]
MVRTEYEQLVGAAFDASATGGSQAVADNFSSPLNMVSPLPPFHLLLENVPSPIPMNVLPPNFPGSETYTNSYQRLVQEIQQKDPVLNQHHYHQRQQQGQNRNQQPDQQQHKNRKIANRCSTNVAS